MKRKLGNWLVSDSGVRSGQENMDIDDKALKAMMSHPHHLPTIRFFQWKTPVVTYGHLLDPDRVRLWAETQGLTEIVKRPTGGGTVFHEVGDLSVSLLWPRGKGYLPENPRLCYAEIHRALKEGVRDYLGGGMPQLYVRPEGSCAPSVKILKDNHLPVCFEEPVCNDVMMGSRKIIGGALRLTRNAVLYQGAIQLRRVVNMEKLKRNLIDSLDRLLNEAAVSSSERVLSA